MKNEEARRGGTRQSAAGRRPRVALVFGGRSAEREVSLMSARTVASALDPRKYERVLLEIDSGGRWALEGPERLLGRAAYEEGLGLLSDGSDGALAVRGAGALLRGVDVLFPLLHGPCGEDGSIQGLARLAGIPCVGADILGSALCMDKDAAKRVLREAGIAVGPFRSFDSPREARSAWRELGDALGDDVFVKPANLGSSVGVSRARSRPEYEAALELAFRYDAKVLVERTIRGREIEVAVLGHRELRASLPGEVVPARGFYDYEAKYLDEEGARVMAPAHLGPDESAACRALALDSCRALCVRGMARVDMFLPEDGKPVASEVNTIPGFTARSMFPLLWEASGLPLPELVDELIRIALAAQDERAALSSAPPAARPRGGE